MAMELALTAGYRKRHVTNDVSVTRQEKGQSMFRRRAHHAFGRSRHLNCTCLRSLLMPSSSTRTA